MRKRMWESTYRGIYQDEMIDGYDLEKHTLSICKHIESGTSRVEWIETDGIIAGYLDFGAPAYGEYRSDMPCVNSLNLLPPFRQLGIGKAVFALLRVRCQGSGATGFYNACNCITMLRARSTAPWAAY